MCGGAKVYVYRAMPKHGYTMSRVNLNTWVWDDRFEIKLQDPGVLAYFTNAHECFHHKMPKRICQSLPAIVLKDGAIISPFTSAVDQVTVKFAPTVPLAKLKFQ